MNDTRPDRSVQEARSDLWAFIRGVLLTGAGIERSCVDVPYEVFSARMDVAAGRLADEWQDRQKAGTP